MDLQAQQRMFGCDLSVLKCAIGDAVKRQHPAMVAMSMCSDIQEMLDHMSCEPGGKERLRQHLNRVKWVLSEHLLHPEEKAA